MPWATQPWDTKAALEACLRRGVIMVFLGIGLGIGHLLLPDQLDSSNGRESGRQMARFWRTSRI